MLKQVIEIIGIHWQGIRRTGVPGAGHVNNWETWNWRIIGIPGAGHGNNWQSSSRTLEKLGYLGHVIRIIGIPGAGHENN
jgi:hypothetical protein